MCKCKIYKDGIKGVFIYHLCLDIKSDDKKYVEGNFKYIGIGIIWEVEGVNQGCKWKRERDRYKFYYNNRQQY